MPQQPAVLGGYADQAFVHRLDVLPDAADLCHDDGAVRRLSFGVLAAPDFFPGLFVESNQQALIAARGDDYLVAVHERTFAVAPADFRLAVLVHDPAVVVLVKIVMPENLAGIGVETRQFALGAQGVDFVAVDRWCTPRAIAPLIILKSEGRPDRLSPKFFAGPDIQDDEELGLAAGAHGIETVADDGGGGIADAGLGESPQ